MIKKDKIVQVYLALYVYMIMVVSYTAMHSPFMAENFNKAIIINSLVLFLTSYYLLGFKRIKIWFKDKVSEAKKKASYRQAVEKEIDRREKAGILL